MGKPQAGKGGIRQGGALLGMAVEMAPPSLIQGEAGGLARVVEQGGCSAGIYMNRQQGYYQYDLSRLADWSLWVADYNDYPDFYYAFDMWQYSDSAALDGVPTQADLNFLFVPSPRG